MPKWHESLGASAGVRWLCTAWLGAGWQLWQHREELTSGRSLFTAGTQGDLTIDASLLQPTADHARRFLREQWDAVVLQLFASHVSLVTNRMWGRELGGDRDVGDLGAATDLIRIFLQRNATGRVFIYQVWPPMDAGRIPPPEEQPAWARAMQNLRAAEFPNRNAFDYAARWLQPYAPQPGQWTGCVHRTRDFSIRVFRGLQERFPELAATGRLQMIPAGDLFMELDRRMREGRVPGGRDIRDFYTDVQHLRFGLPRYTVAALFFCALFDAPPDRLDWRLYNNRDAYGPDPYHDGGEMFPITAENAAAVHTAIRDLLATHPFAGWTGRGLTGDGS
ncbi:MAG: hypothetical protein N2652_05180 [Kiritimatiellae bacterium]|nr:hypothetical protein [Kiritimatiellia bacterium]